ncbi:EAL domain-containing protein [Mycobacterium deserti]|uniref:EAL domain-containing protein n=1 Tax=Mycobacterium deserti TaxID=2978347 RepID=A0ABT2MB53_9MYCO|nr:EAL domain-containing protein [Mycobacterium deserti]MCT7658395.1 EAL domain-containing protein [Mycobacterium deserti]
MTRPHLVPPATDLPPPGPRPSPHEGLINQLGFRPDAGVDAASTGVGLMPMFQPVVSLPDEGVVGFEALARWPVFASVTPQNVFTFANQSRRADDLDRQCIEAAAQAALDAEMPRGSMLLLNTEPSVAHVRRSPHSALSQACERFQVVFELTERQLIAHPRALLDKVSAIRDDGIAIAVDDVGAHPESLAVLDVVAPDIVKLDMTMIQSSPQRDRAYTLTGVLAYQERTGALIIAEGVENDDHLEQSMAFGASLAQGFRFGHAAPLNRHQYTAEPPRLLHTNGSQAAPPADHDRKALRVARREIVAALARHIEDQARHAVDHPMVLAAVQRPEDFTVTSRQVYNDLAMTSPLVAVFGRGMPVDIGVGIRSVELEAGDPLCDEWVLVTLGADTCRALVARELPTHDKCDGDRRYEFLITSDRAMVTKAAKSLLERVP